MLAAFVEEKGLPPEKIDKLRQILDRTEADQQDKQ
jgi:hypothetical protein